MTGGRAPPRGRPIEQAVLEPADVADLTVLADTVMPSTQAARRAPLVYEWSEGDQLRAEHGFARHAT